MSAPDKIKQLIETFEQNITEYRSLKNETELRLQFLNPLFEALGWDMDNKKGASESEKEVAHEFSVEIDGQQKKADYAFSASKENKGKFDFLVEAKKPSVRIESNLDAAFQIRRYGWSAKIPINILTDFEHFAVYDCRVKPKYGEKAVLNRLTLIHYKEYLERWDEIGSLFSPEAIRNGSLSEYVKSIKGKKGTADVDDDFLQEIERWRELLAKSIASNNDWIDISGLNYAVQMIIDRIVFLRICEERSIEPENQLQDIANKENVYKELFTLFKRADTKYNSGLFHFKKESGEASHADDLTPRLVVGDKTLKDIILNLYYPKSPYAFLYIPSDILGQVYERFLGKVIRLTEGHRAKVEEKPEVKKAGGVFYTPTFIVEYIVANTVGRIVNPTYTPKEVAKLKIVDPACGSGTFLLGAFQYLLDWHLKWYTENDPEKWANGKSPAVYQSVTYQRKSEIKEDSEGRRVIRDSVVDVRGEWRLTTAKKKEILLNNIFGVDIDPQAVEVTKLSLLLKVLEDLNGQLTLGMDRLLPDLGNNIKCGNSLVGEDYFEGKLMAEQEERNRVNTFDWKDTFPEVFSQGGFDVVIGNPPYGADFSQELRHYLAGKFDVSVNIADSFILFIAQSLRLIKKDGWQGFITPSTWLYMPTYTNFRKTLLTDFKFQKLLLFRKLVFEDAVVETCIEILHKSKSPNNKFELIEIKDEPAMLSGNSLALKQNILISQEESNFLQNDKSKESHLFSKVAKKGISFGKVSLIVCGLTPYRKGKGKPAQTQAIVENRSFDSDHKVNKTYRQYLMGRDFHRYQWNIQKSRWISYGDWLAEPRHAAPFNDEVKIVIRQTADSIISQIDKNQYLSLKNVHNVRILGKNLDYSYLLGLLNSRLITWWYRQLIPEKGRVFAEVKVVNLEKLPIRTINFDEPAEKSAHDKIVSLVEKMLDLHKRLAPAQDPRDKEDLEKQIASTDKGIDKLVYGLYGLSEEEIRIVES